MNKFYYRKTLWRFGVADYLAQCWTVQKTIRFESIEAIAVKFAQVRFHMVLKTSLLNIKYLLNLHLNFEFEINLKIISNSAID